MAEPPADVPAAASTLHAAMRAVGERLRAGGIAFPTEEARELVLTAAGLTPLALVRDPGLVLSAAQSARIGEFVSRRLHHEPLTRIAGEREFFGRRFLLSPATLDPRPDSEVLIEAVLELVEAEGWSGRPLRVLDLGTGTGCLLLTLLAELPHAHGVGVDLAAGAVATATLNAERLGVADRVWFVCGDGSGAVREPGSFDVVVSNPPYIATAEIAELEPEVRDFDPLAALDGGSDGLDFYRAWVPAALHLARGGWIAFEVGAGQAEAVAGIMMRHAGAGPGQTGATAPAPARTWKDLGGHTRVVAIRSQY